MLFYVDVFLYIAVGHQLQTRLAQVSFELEGVSWLQEGVPISESALKVVLNNLTYTVFIFIVDDLLLSLVGMFLATPCTCVQSAGADV